MEMHKKPQPIFLIFFFLLCGELLHFTLADIGIAAQYRPPYLPTACWGNDATNFPTSNLFAAAGEGVWDDGASCGRRYQVSCLSTSNPGICKAGETIGVVVVDRAQTSVSRPSRNGATLVLSSTAFAAIANPSASSINIEFSQV